jgi:hypothetical protein
MKSRMVRWVGHVPHMRNAFKILIRNPVSERLLRRFRCRGQDNLKMDLQEI